jgi:hypothetical protein
VAQTSPPGRDPGDAFPPIVEQNARATGTDFAE